MKKATSVVPMAFGVVGGGPGWFVGVYRGFHVANGIQPMGQI